MKYLIAVLMIFIGLPILAQKKSIKSVDSIAKIASRAAGKDYSLNVDQQKKYEETWKWFHKKLALIASSKKDTLGRRNAYIDAEKVFDDSLKKIFTADQYNNYKKQAAAKQSEFDKRAASKGIKVKRLE